VKVRSIRHLIKKTVTITTYMVSGQEGLTAVIEVVCILIVSFATGTGTAAHDSVGCHTWLLSVILILIVGSIKVDKLVFSRLLVVFGSAIEVAGVRIIVWVLSVHIQKVVYFFSISNQI